MKECRGCEFGTQMRWLAAALTMMHVPTRLAAWIRQRRALCCMHMLSFKCPRIFQLYFFQFHECSVMC